MRTVHCRYQNLMTQIDGKVLHFRNGKVQVDDQIAFRLIQRPGYWLSTTDSYKTAKKVLISRNMGIGDVLFVSTVPAFIKKLNPNCHLTFATFPKHRRLLEKHPFIDEIEDISKLQNVAFIDKFDYFKCFNNYFEVSEQSDRQKIAIHRVDMLRNFFEAKAEDWDNNYYLHVYDEEQKYIRELISPILDKKIVAVVTQATELTRRYPNVQRLIQRIAEEGFGVIVISPGSDTKYVLSNIVDLSGKTSIGQMIAALDAANLVISPDSGPLHIAGGLKKKIITFFNSFPPQSRVRYYKDCFAFYPEKACPIKRMPCMYSRCPAPCLKSIDPEEFIKKIREMI